jgi:hypothetical protein
MSASEEPSHHKVVAGLGMPSEKTLLTIIAVAFLILHILAGSLLLGPATGQVAPEAAAPSSYDQSLRSD